MSDRRLRELERAAAAGGADDQQRYLVALDRAGAGGPFPMLVWREEAERTCEAAMLMITLIGDGPSRWLWQGGLVSQRIKATIHMHWIKAWSADCLGRLRALAGVDRCGREA